MQNWFVIRIYFLHRRYHGRSEGWPPSPLRLFQAIVAGARTGRWLHEDSVNTEQALLWLEKLGAPKLIIAPFATKCCVYRIAVPNNQADTAINAWIKGSMPLEDLLRSTKEIKEVRPAHVGHGVVRYAWQIPESEHIQASKACKIVRRMYSLGTGLDHVVADAKIAPWKPEENRGDFSFLLSAFDTGRQLDAPTVGTTFGLTKRHDLRLGRLQNGQLSESDYAISSKRHSYTQKHQMARPHCLIFALRDPSDDSIYATNSALSAARVSVAIRNELAARLREAVQRFPEYVNFNDSEIKRFVTGQGANEDDKPARIVFLPLPSIGHDHADGAIRRLMVVVPLSCPIPVETVKRALDRKVVETTPENELRLRVRLELLDESSLDLVTSETEKRMCRRFIPSEGAQSWRSVTPVILPGFLPKGGRTKKEPEAALYADINRRKRAFELAEKALRHAGLDPNLIAITRLQLEPFRARDKRADDDWLLPISQMTGQAWLSHRPRAHIELTTKEPIPGPLVIGDGRFLGLGLFTADVLATHSQAYIVPKGELTDINRETGSSVLAMLLSMRNQRANKQALPLVTLTLPQSELLHRAMTSIVTRNKGTHTVLTGCDELKRPLKGPHDHAHILPLDLDGDGHLDHVLIWAPGGLDGSAQRAIRAVRRTHTKGGIEPLRLALVGAGSTDDLRLLPDEYGRRIGIVFGPGEGARKWWSLTPFVAPRYLKKNGNNALAGQVASELASRGFPAPVEVRVLETGDHPEFLCHRHFTRKRRSGPQPPADFGYSLEIRFDEPVFGPLCLGYGSHFGLGLFSSVN